jgi:hypothetical protein
VKRAFKADTVWVREVIIVTKGRSQQTYATAPEVEGFLESYDSAILEFESPRPFSFTLGAAQLPGVNAVKASKASQRGEITDRADDPNKKADGD